jgi:hypothetical protein
MPLLPAAMNTPPLMVAVLPVSMAPFPLSTGPLTRVTPAVTTMLPLESMPSPEAVTTRYPPLMVIIFELSAAKLFCPALPLTEDWSFPPAAFSPSSEAVTETVPPATVISPASRPS